MAQPVWLPGVISFGQANLPAGVDTAAGFCHFDSICQQAPAIKAGVYVAGGNKPAQLLVVALLIGLDYSKVGSRNN